MITLMVKAELSLFRPFKIKRKCTTLLHTSKREDHFFQKYFANKQGGIAWFLAHYCQFWTWRSSGEVCFSLKREFLS